ncbi:hypothetical protein IAR55_005790 [Kwoniella newhampshirensis]|uniref:EXPERA domain-containing protein n=1 Tax=Kwoniella newhampshirensis TaxID=1651941 RepID=A0AAW0YVK4_9TREE
MTLLATLYSFQTPLTLLLILFGPSLLPRLISLIARRGRPAFPTRSSPRPASPTSLRLFLAIHSLYFLSHLLRPPYDLFAINNFPILVPNNLLRSALLGPDDSESLSTLEESVHPLIDLLLSKLRLLDNRYLYARFGHDTLLNCVWCKDDLDYLFYSSPGILIPYVGEAVVLGMMGWRWLTGEAAGPRAERWRSVFGWVLVGGMVGEVGAKWFWEVRAVEGDCLHLATTIHILRSILLLCLPLLYTFLPLPAPSSVPHPSTLIPVISNTQSTLRLTSLARNAMSSSPRLRDIWLAVSRRDEARAEAALRDQGVRDAKRAVGLDEERMREGVRAWVREGWEGMVRVDNGS